MSPIYRNPHDPVDFDLQMPDGRRCKVLPLSAQESRSIAATLMATIGKSVRQAAASGAHPVLLEMASFGFIVEELAATSRLESLTQKFLPTTQVEREPGTDEFLPLAQLQDLLFAGDGMARWIRWLTFCLELNTSSFFAEAQRLGPTLRTAMGLPAKKESPSPSSSPKSGSSTE